MARRTDSTATSNFGVSRRESHDSSSFYARFVPPTISTDEEIAPIDAAKVDQIYIGDSRKMDLVDDNSVALVITSPPYFVGKEYEEALGEGYTPATYFEYLTLLEEVFRECVRKLQPGGRIAVNVANLGRKPYRSLSADVIEILQDRLALLLRGEIIWVKGKAAGSSCAWGSFQSPANPVLRDMSERIVIASKGMFGRAISRKDRANRGLPSEASIAKDEFMESTTDVWDIPPESAKRVGHPAPFPVELPERLLNLYTYAGDLVLDPFVGSGSTAIAAVRTERHFVGYDLDPAYKEIADRRVEEEHQRRIRLEDYQKRRVAIPALPREPSPDEDFQARAVREGRQAKEIAFMVLQAAGYKNLVANQKVSGGVRVNFMADDDLGERWIFDVSGAFTSSRAGLRRTDTLWKALGKAAVLYSSMTKPYRLILLTTDLPAKGSAGDAALKAARPQLVFEVVELLSPEGQYRLNELARGVAASPDLKNKGDS